MKYKLVGITNILFGIIQALYPVIVYMFVMPKLWDMYSSLNIDNPIKPAVYIGLIFLFFYGIFNIIMGVLLFSERFNKDKLLIWNIILILLNFVFGGLVSGLLMIGIIAPIYSISSSI